LVDAREPRRQQCCESEVGVEIGAANAALDANTFGALAAETKTRRAVVEAPYRLRRRECAHLKSFVGVDVGGEEVGDVACILDLTGHELPHQLRHAEL